MSAPHDWSASQEMRSWAAEQIGAVPDASAAECRAAVLRALPADDFVPVEGVKAAARLLTSQPGTAAAGAGYLADRETSLRIRIDDFAAEFFNLDPTERRRRYQQLQELVAPLPALRARLSRLERGLRVAKHPSSRLRGDVAELCEHICALFALPPRAAVARRQELHLPWAREAERWQLAARALLALAPDVAVLQAPLLERLRLGPMLREVRARRRAERAGTSALSASSVSGLGQLAGLFFLGIFVVGMVLNLLGFSESRRPQNRRSPSIPTIRDIRVPEPIRDLDLEVPPEWDIVVKDRDAVFVPRGKRVGETTRRLMDAIQKDRDAKTAPDQEGGGP